MRSSAIPWFYVTVSSCIHQVSEKELYLDVEESDLSTGSEDLLCQPLALLQHRAPQCREVDNGDLIEFPRL